VTIIVRKLIPATAPATAPAITLDLARDMVETAAAIIATLDGRRTTEVERQNVLSDAFDLAFYITGEPQHLNAEGIEARARVLAAA
jgi:hypothetical protein